MIRSMPQRQIMKVNENHTPLAFADDIVIMGDTK